jgi:RNA polymerase sigma-70 factor (ECF subfamily)
VSAVETELLYRRHAHRVLRYCARYLRPSFEAEDALQQTFLRAHRALDRGVEPVSEEAWLLAIARNVCLNRIDAARRRDRVEFAQDPHVLASTAAMVDSVADGPEDVYAALAQLPERQRRALFLREWHGLSYAEIASELGTSTDAVETLLFRARRSLAARLADRRRALDLAGLLGWGRSLLASTAPKLGVGAVALAVGAAAGTQLLHHPAPRRHLPGPAAGPDRWVPAAASFARPVRTAAPRAAHRRRDTTTDAHSAPPPSPGPSATVAASHAAEARPTPDTRVAAASPAAAPSAPPREPTTAAATTTTTTTTVTTALPQPVQSAVDTTTTAVGGVVSGAAQTLADPTQAISTTATAATDALPAPVSSAAAPVASTAQSATSTVASAAPALPGP